MRIIAGTCRGAQICAPRGMDTRPTQDKVRESLFSIIQAYVPGASVLDLFAGSGALGLEALSRGAGFAAFADHRREAAACIRKNIEKLRLADATRLYLADWRQALAQMKAEGRRFDLVFLDPPYRLPVLEACCEALAQSDLLQRDALLVAEHLTAVPPEPGADFALWKQRAYGDTEIHFYFYRPTPPEEGEKS